MNSQLKMLFALEIMLLYTAGGKQMNIATPPKGWKREEKNQI